jgi:hypothetical protein
VLRDVDTTFLEEHEHPFTAYPEGDRTLLVLEAYELPTGYEPATVDLLLEIPSTYPDGKIDMWWIHPPVVFTSSRAAPVNTDVRHAFPGYKPDPARQWQRFSRHPEWRPGIDDLRSYLQSMRSTLEAEAAQAGA